MAATTKRLAGGGCWDGDCWSRCLSVRAANPNRGRLRPLRDRCLADARVPRPGLERTGAGVLETASERRGPERAAAVRRTDTDGGASIGERTRLPRGNDS